MKHTTNGTAGAARVSQRRQVALRPDADEMVVIEELAKREMRSIAQMALICFRHGLREIQTRSGRAEG